MWEFWVDRGGTFTDIVARDLNGKFKVRKLLSENPELYKDAAVQGIRELMQLTASEPFQQNTISVVKMGTTVATNALLERKGDSTLLLITKGFGDLLRIGYQNRPKLFDLNIKLPSLLYEQVNEIQERLDAHGNIITPLNVEDAKKALQTGYENGFRSVAIAFMHGYLNAVHEKQVAEIAKRIGFTQISTSHETSRLIKLVSRGDTCVVDAYLSPILRRYVDQVADELDVGGGACQRLFFMQSNGGLTDASKFQGRDSIVSGPAGGVVGMARTAELAGFHELIGFDMGGTSTDVCHYNGKFERSLETEVAGVRMRAPMMNIHTVAAGGGSILTFKDGRFQVGPESAGANPGPACYRRGGPLTVTDCNVMLGKLNPDYFPSVFGPSGDQPIDTKIVKEKFQQLAEKIAKETGKVVLSPEETAEGFLKIAVENMANAIKKISVQKGHDITHYTLNCFGGAGGQHACLVADSLGMSRIFLHPFSGVLSAFGMGLAEIRVLKENQFEASLSKVQEASNLLDKMEQEAVIEVQEQGVERKNIHTERYAHLRYSGSYQNLIVKFASADQMKLEFENSHRHQFGFISDNREIMMDILSVEAIGDSIDAEALHHNDPAESSNNDIKIDCFTSGKMQSIPLKPRQYFSEGDILQGPAIISEETGTVVVEKGWQAKIDPLGNLILERYEALEREKAIGTDANPIMLEIFNNLFMSIAEQMGVTLANTAYSVNIKERYDFSCALFDSEANLVANAPHMPVHLGSMGESVRIVAQKNKGKMRPGDSYMLNAPFSGGTHLPDVTVITPVFDKTGQNILFYVGSRGHHADIGGRTPGSAPPDSRHIEEEGVVIDNFQLVKDGKLREEETRALLSSGKYPCRNVDENIADLEAQIAANATGIQEVHRMIDHFGFDVVSAYMKHVQDNAEESVRRVIGNLKSGSFEYPLDTGLKICVNISVDQEKREAVLDFTGTSPQDEKNYNAPLSVCHAAVLYVFRTLVADDIPLNQGCLKPLKIIAPTGSMINPEYPAAVIAGNTEVSQSITECIYGALGVMAGSQGTMNNFAWGSDKFQNYETICGGTGAGPNFNGTSAVHSHMTNTRMTDPEVLEKRFPVHIEEFSIERGSGGKGQYNGGDGARRRLRFLKPVTVTTLSSHRKERPYGMHGGEEGACGQNYVIRSDGTRTKLQGNDEAQLSANDVFEIVTPSGGGWGKPD